jgi:hypothetical protein
VTQRLLAVLPLLALAGCGGGQSAPAQSAGGAVVEIAEPSEEEASAAAEETPAPAARRTQGPSTVAGGSSEEPPASDTPWAQPSPWGGAGGGGPDCDRAADCCLKVVQKNGTDPSLLSMCDSVRQAPHSSCTHLLSSFRSVAPQIGIQCN